MSVFILTDMGLIWGHSQVYREDQLKESGEWTSLLLKAISLPINCMVLKLFPEGVATDQTTPRGLFPV